MKEKYTQIIFKVLSVVLIGLSALRTEAFEPYAKLTAASTNIVITESTHVLLSVYLPAQNIKELGEEHPPFMPRRAPHVTAPFVEPQWSSPAIEKGDVSEMLPRERQSGLGFTLNNFASDPFESMMSRNPFESMFDRDPFESLSSRRKVFPVEVVQEERDGTNVWCFTMKFPSFKAVSPGTVKIEGVSVKVPLIDKLSRDRYGRHRVHLKEVVLNTSPLEIVVVEPPQSECPDSYCGAIGSNVTVKASLDTNVCTAGDPMILTLDIEGMANPSSVTAPRLMALSTNEFFKVDESSLKTDTTGRSRRFTWRMRVLKAGTIEFPSLDVAYYDLSQRGYKIFKTSPIPVQVKAGAQIALQVEDQVEGEIPFPMPDGIDLDENGWKAVSMFKNLNVIIMLIILPPFVFLLFRFLPGVATSLLARRREKRVKGSFKKCWNVLSRTSDVRRKERAVREFLSVRYDVNGATATAMDAKRLMKDDFTDEEINLVVSALEEIDNARYSSRGGAGRVLSLLIVVAMSLMVTQVFASVSKRGEFSWQRAISLSVNAQTEDDFLRASDAYRSCIQGGAENPVAYYNLASCLLMAGKASQAYEAFSKVERYTGSTPSTLRGLTAARARMINDPRAKLSLMRVFFMPHFRYSFNTRLLVFSIAWAVLWGLLLLPKGWFKNAVVTLTAIFLIVSAVSVSISFMSEHLSEEITDVQ